MQYSRSRINVISFLGLSIYDPSQFTSNNFKTQKSNIKPHATFLTTSTHYGKSQASLISLCYAPWQPRLTWHAFNKVFWFKELDPRTTAATLPKLTPMTRGGWLGQLLNLVAAKPSPREAWRPAPFRTPSRRNSPSGRSNPELLAKPPSPGVNVGNLAQRRRRRGTPSSLGSAPRVRTGVRAGLGRLTLQSLRTNIMPWPGYIGPEQK